MCDRAMPPLCPVSFPAAGYIRYHRDLRRGSLKRLIQRENRAMPGNRAARLLLALVNATLLVAGGIAAPSEAKDEPTADSAKLVLHARTRVETKPGSGRFHAMTEAVEWDPRKTAIVICDMWDKHWCQGATRRVAEMAPRMNEVVAAARKQGVLIIHCPSGTLDFYKDTPQR